MVICSNASENDEEFMRFTKEINNYFIKCNLSTNRKKFMLTRENCSGCPRLSTFSVVIFLN